MRVEKVDVLGWPKFVMIIYRGSNNIKTQQQQQKLEGRFDKSINFVNTSFASILSFRLFLLIICFVDVYILLQCVRKDYVR